MHISRSTLFRTGVILLAAVFICGCGSPQRKPRPPAAASIPPQPLPVEYPDERTDWDTGAPVMIFSLPSLPGTVQFVGALKPALVKRGYTVVDMPFHEGDWMASAMRAKARLVIPETYVRQDGPLYQGTQVADICQQVLVADAGDEATPGAPRIRTFHVWARQQKDAPPMETLVENLMRLPAFRKALEPTQGKTDQ